MYTSAAQNPLPYALQESKYSWCLKVKSVGLETSYNVAPTSLAYASVLKDFGRSIGAPRARSMMSCGSTPRALETPNSTV